jgi:hypothetical protein
MGLLGGCYAHTGSETSVGIESASSLLVDFGVLNDNLIK